MLTQTKWNLKSHGAYRHKLYVLVLTYILSLKYRDFRVSLIVSTFSTSNWDRSDTSSSMVVNVDPPPLRLRRVVCSNPVVVKRCLGHIPNGRAIVRNSIDEFVSRKYITTQTPISVTQIPLVVVCNYSVGVESENITTSLCRILAVPSWILPKTGPSLRVWNFLVATYPNLFAMIGIQRCVATWFFLRNLNNCRKWIFCSSVVVKRAYPTKSMGKSLFFFADHPTMQLYAYCTYVYKGSTRVRGYAYPGCINTVICISKPSVYCVYIVSKFFVCVSGQDNYPYPEDV